MSERFTLKVATAERNGYHETPDPVNNTDTGNARRLVRLHGEDLRYCHPWRKWLVFDARRWRHDDTGEVVRRAKEVIRDMYRGAAARLSELADEEEGDEKADKVRQAEVARLKKLLGWALVSESAPRLAAMVELAKSEPGVPVLPADLDRDPFLLNCGNGTLDLRTGELRDPCRDDMITKLCPTHYRPDAPAPVWELFLESTFPATGDAAEQLGDGQLIGYVQRSLGYGLSGDVSEHVLLIFHGPGSNGKSVLLNAAQEVLGGDYVMKAPPELLTVRKGEAHPTERADLFGRRLVLAIETEAGARLAESLVKELTGGDPIRARRMREDFWQFNPTHKVILCTNHKPKVRGTDHAIWRRLRLVPFVVKFWDPDKGESGPPRLKADKKLSGKLRSEAEGVLAWMVRGCLDWQRDGLKAPAVVNEATSSYRGEEDVVGAFVAERCQTGGADFRCTSGDLYSAFRSWCEQAGERDMSRKDFGHIIAGTEGIERYTSNGTWYRGIALRQTEGG